MHIPDGFIDTKTIVTSSALAFAGLWVALVNVRKALPDARVPLVGLTSAFIFVAQMINFPVLGGTSGHLIGGVLAAILLGPSAAVLVMASVVILQAFLFADGGVTALGANIFNMAIVAPISGYVIYRAVAKVGARSKRHAHLIETSAIAIGSWVSAVAAGISCGGELAFAGILNWRVAFFALAGVHALIAIGEAIITTLVVVFIRRLRPQLISSQVNSGVVVYSLLMCTGLTLFVVPFACGWPDGLSKVAELFGFEKLATQLFNAPLLDYSVAGIKSPVTMAIVGSVGTLATFIGAYILARILTRQTRGFTRDQ